MRPAVRTELREVHAPPPYPRVAYPLIAQFARERGRRHTHRPSPRLETPLHPPEADCRQTGKHGRESSTAQRSPYRPIQLLACHLTTRKIVSTHNLIAQQY